MKTRKLILGVLIATLVLLMGGLVAYAQDGIIQSLPGGGWWEASQVMNIAEDLATVTFIPVLGHDVPSVSSSSTQVTITPRSSITFLPADNYGNLDLGDGFKGSAIVRSDRPILGIGSIANNPLYGGGIGIEGGRAAAQYSATPLDAASNQLAFPVVKNDYRGKTTTFYVQTIEPGTIEATYSMNLGQDTYEAEIATNTPGQMVTFSPSDAGVPATCDGTSTGFGCLGAVIFSSNVKLAGMYVEHNTGVETIMLPAQIALSTRGFTPGDFDTTVMVPVVKSMWRGRTTGIQIQNVGAARSTVTFTLAYQDGDAETADGKSVTFQIDPGASDTFFPGNHQIFVGPLPPAGTDKIDDEFLGSATIVSDQPMTVIVNENDFAAADVSKQTVFAAFTKKSGTSTVLFPLVKEGYQGNNTGVQVMNVGEVDVVLEADYVMRKVDGTIFNFTVDENDEGDPIVVEAGRSFTFYGVTQWWSGSYDTYYGGSGAVTARATPQGSGDAWIVGIAQEAEIPPGGGLNYLDTKNYEGFNR